MYGTLHKRIYELMFRDDLDRPLTPLLNSGKETQDNDENTSAINSSEGSLDSELEQRYNNIVWFDTINKIKIHAYVFLFL